MIRAAINNDIPEIIALLKQVHKIHSDGRPDYFKAGGIKYTEDELSDLFRDKDRPVFVYEGDSKKILGYIFCIVNTTEDSSSLNARRSLYIDDLCVDSDARHIGIGTQLYKYATEYAKKNGFNSITLRVWAFNKDAISFYEGLGMKAMHTTMEQIL